MTATDSPKKISSEDFFAELQTGRKVTEKANDGRLIELVLRSPTISDTEQAYAIIEGLRYDSDMEIERSRLIQLACWSCIDGVTPDNVMAFLSYFPPTPKIVIECLRLLRIGDEDLQRLNIYPYQYESTHPF